MTEPETSPKRPPSPLLSVDPRAVLTFTAEKDGTLRVTYPGWEDPRIFKPGESIEVLVAHGQVKAYRRGEPLLGPAPDPYREYGA